MLALKGNQKTLYEDVKLLLNDEEKKKDLRESGRYQKTEEKAHGQIEIREYYQMVKTGWLEQ